MTGLDILLWGVRTLSIFNTVAFVWLGLTVLLNAQQRKPVTWITGLGLLLAGLFFAIHSTFVGARYRQLRGRVGLLVAVPLAALRGASVHMVPGDRVLQRRLRRRSPPGAAGGHGLPGSRRAGADGGSRRSALLRGRGPGR